MTPQMLWTKEAVKAMLEYEVTQSPQSFTSRWDKKNLQRWLTWIAICHEAMKGNQEYTQKFQLTVSEAGDQYLTIKNLFNSSGWTLTYVPSKRGFSARIK